jgi:transcription-repair coupling factor (superfamily II helicase)
MVRDLSEVRIGDPVVHEEHGIGRYLGLVTLDVGDGDTEFLELLYAKDAKLYVPVSSLHLISRYSGASPEAAPLHELGSGQWEKAKRKAAAQAHDTAAELLDLYAQRAARQGHAFGLKQHDYEAFAEGFGFEETPDQQAAIEAVIDDLSQGRPMDRLVCGDVGFGKTEVALRAAFIALADGKQVALLVPTTLLAEQHFQVFSDRFADWPVKLAELSRFRSGKEVKSVLEGLANGTVDMVIGTHKLLQSDVRFQKLGLVIIDEEHRFGVRQKEQLKRLRAEVDVLTLTATPIPRTLAMSLEELGAGFVLATHDHEIRGAGELLGESQSGELTEIGLTMYLDLLEQAVKALKEGREPVLDRPLAATAEVELRLPALLPESYVADVPVRLAMYKRLAAAPDNAAIDALTEEIVDRFGPLPPPATNLLRVARLKLMARAIGIRRLDLGREGGYALFEESNQVDPKAVIRLVQHPDRDYRLEGPLKLRISVETDDDAERFEFAEKFLAGLRGPGDARGAAAGGGKTGSNAPSRKPH